MKEHIAIYCRVSTLDQARFGFSLSDQERRIRQYLTAMKEPDTYEVEVFREEGISAKNTNRPELQRLLKKVNHHEINQIYILTLSRLTRNVSDLCNLIETFNRNEVEFTSLTEQIDTRSAHGRFFVYLLGCLAQLEREEISERTKRGIDESAVEGNYPYSRPPFGYKKIDKKLIPDETKASAIKEIFRKIAIEDYTVYLLTLELNQNHTCNIAWTENRIYKIIYNPIYYGMLERGELHIENHSPAIVSKELWEQANKQINHYRKAVPGKYIFRGHVTCAKCGKLMVGKSTVKKKTKKRYLYYYCYECHKNLSEIKLLNRINKELSLHFRIYEYSQYVNTLSKSHNKFSSVFSKLNYAKANGNIEQNFYCKEMEAYQAEWRDILDKLTKAYETLKNANFRSLRFRDQRIFLAKTVSEIQVDFDTKKVKIKWK